MLHALLHSQLYVLKSHINHFYKNPNHLIFCTYTNVHHDSSFALNCMHLQLIHICIDMIHTELKILFRLPSNSIRNFQLPSNCSNYIKSNTFKFRFFYFFGIQTRAYESSIVLQLPSHLLTLIVDG